MKTFKQLIESLDYMKKAQDALLAGDHKSAFNHLKNHVDGKSRARDAEVAKLRMVLRKRLKEDAPANAIAHDGVDMNPNGGYKKIDKRNKWHPDNMFRRANGV